MQSEIKEESYTITGVLIPIVITLTSKIRISKTF